MRHTPRYVITDAEEVRRLIRKNPWATFVSPASTGLVASHYPVLLDPVAPSGAESGNTGADAGIYADADDAISIVSHFGRPDEVLHELGQHEILVIIQGPHDYVSPSWYTAGEVIPTWNHVTAHLYGTVEVLSEEENYAMLGLLTDHFEQDRPHGRSLAADEAGTRRTAKGTVGLRMRVTRFDARAKLSQNKSSEVIENIAAQLSDTNPALASEMRRAAGE